MHSVKNSNDFLGWYNKIDKFFAQLIGAKNYIPFIEKVTLVAEGDYAQSQFVRQYQNKLRYFGDLRNQLVHGFSLDQNHYVVASDHAVEQIARIHEQLAKPKSVSQIFTNEVFTCKMHDDLSQVIQSMRNDLNTHVPVYDKDDNFIEMLSESTIAYRVADQADQQNAQDDTENISIKNLQVKDIPLENSNDTFVFVDQERSVYEIEQLFFDSAEDHKRLGAVFITENGQKDEKITGIITSLDLPKLASMRIL